jgi:hypothetical protein
MWFGERQLICRCGDLVIMEVGGCNGCNVVDQNRQPRIDITWHHGSERLLSACGTPLWLYNLHGKAEKTHTAPKITAFWRLWDHPKDEIRYCGYVLERTRAQEQRPGFQSYALNREEGSFPYVVGKG